MSKQYEPLQVTSCIVHKIKEPSGKNLAFAQIVLNEQFNCNGLRVVDGSNGLFVAFPNDPGYKGDDYRSLMYPLVRELRAHIEESVIAAYNQKCESESVG